MKGLDGTKTNDTTVFGELSMRMCFTLFCVDLIANPFLYIYDIICALVERIRLGARIYYLL
jgi:hypothetical protein